MSREECANRTQIETKPQRSFFHRFLHSSLFRSCWSTTQPTLEEPAVPSTSLLANTNQSNYESNNITRQSPKLCSNQEVYNINNKNDQLVQPGQPKQVAEVIVDSYSTSGSDTNDDHQEEMTTVDSTTLQDGKALTGTSLADYLRSESHHSGQGEEADQFLAISPAEQLTEWQRFTTTPGIPTPKNLQNGVYDDLIAHALDDYDEKVELEHELENRESNEPIQFGPLTREEYIRLTFCRIKRHNACSKIQNDVPKSYYFSSQVGEGSFSTVYEAYRMEDKKQYAIKVANKRQIARERKAQYVIREKDIMATLNYGFTGHPFIAGIFCTFQEDDKLYYVLSYAANGELLMWLRRLGSFDLQVSQFYASEIVSALEYIHECGVIHRDLKPENILIRKDWHIMLSDFGSAKVIGYEGDEQLKGQLKTIKQRSTFVGTAQYLSPEVAGGRSCGPEADFWALGGIIFQMISGQPPFRGINEYQILQKVNKLHYKFPTGFDETGKDLVKQLLVPEVENRLGHNGIEEIKEHPFFKEIDWDTIITKEPPVLKPYLPASSGEPEFYSEISVSQMELGLTNSTIARLMGIAQIPQYNNQNAIQPDANRNTSIERKKISEISRQEKLDAQKREHPYHNFVDDALILKSGLIDKKKGLFARRRMFLLTDNGRLLYVDPVKKVLKGEIPISREIRTEAKNFRTFFVHTPTRTYFLFDPNRRAIDWCKSIEEVRNSVFGKPSLDKLVVSTGNQRCTKNSVRQFKASISN